ncbi:MAG: MerR family transcriptional regulator [Chloroflexota bacterium]
MSDTLEVADPESVTHVNESWDRASQPATSPRLYLTSDLRAATGLPRTHMDFYLREGIIQPTTRTESGYLLFDERELDILRHVLAWRQEGVSLREVRERRGRPAPSTTDSPS